jgi:hypothetical protein
MSPGDPVITSIFENVSDIGLCLGLSLGPPAKAGARSKRGAVHLAEVTKWIKVTKWTKIAKLAHLVGEKAVFLLIEK